MKQTVIIGNPTADLALRMVVSADGLKNRMYFPGCVPSDAKRPEADRLFPRDLLEQSGKERRDVSVQVAQCMRDGWCPLGCMSPAMEPPALIS